MLSRLAARRREPAFWLALSALVLAQLVAFYLLCTHQVRQAENRRAGVVVQQVAAVDCQDPSFTGSCTVVPGKPRGQAAQAVLPVTLVSR